MAKSDIFYPFHPKLFKILICYANSDDGIMFSTKKSSGYILWHFGENLVLNHVIIVAINVR